MKIAVYPGSFDPPTNGHVDIIERSSQLFDRIIVSVSSNPGKNPMFTVNERKEMLREIVKPHNNVFVDSFHGLTVDFARQQGAQVIIRGLRAISDFENEFMMALTNKKLALAIETMFLMTRPEFSFISSTAVKEIAYFGGCLEKLVPPYVEEKLRLKVINT